MGAAFQPRSCDFKDLNDFNGFNDLPLTARSALSLSKGLPFTNLFYYYLGPTAIPALGRENYGLIRGIDAEGLAILYRDAVLFFANPKFRDVALKEPRKYLTPFFFNSASKLVKELHPSDIEPADKVGIRAQLVDWD